jgi:hypothetical protein
MATSTTSFTLTRASTRQDLADACAVRAAAYGHHLPELSTTLGRPDALDQAPGTAVLLCRNKASGHAIATARIQLSVHGPLQIERSVALPAALEQDPRAEITRLAVCAGADPQARLLLMKASYLYCLANQVRWMVIGARNQALIRNYRRLGFEDPGPQPCWAPLAHAGQLPHQVLAFDVREAESRWRERGQPLHTYMIHTHHPDLQLFGGVTESRALPARAAA